MARWSALAPVLLVVLSVGCASSKSTPPPPDPDPTTEPTIIGAVAEGAMQGAAEAEEAAIVGRRVGRVAGVLAAVLGGPEVESDRDIVERYRRTRDAVTDAAVVIGATHGAVEGAQRGLALDRQFAELTKIEGVTATRPFPDIIEVRFTDRALLPKVEAVFAESTDVALRVIEDDADGMLVRVALR